MIETYTYAVGAGALVVALWAGWLTLRNRPVDNALFYAASVLEVALIVQLVSGCIALAGSERDVNGATFIAYLVTVVLVPPAAVLWGIAEKSRWGIGVLMVGMLTVSALCLRIVDLWFGHYA